MEAWSLQMDWQLFLDWGVTSIAVVIANGIERDAVRALVGMNARALSWIERLMLSGTGAWSI